MSVITVLAIQVADVNNMPTVDEVTREYAKVVYEANNRNKVKTATDLGISLKTLYNWLAKWGWHGCEVANGVTVASMAAAGERATERVTGRMTERVTAGITGMGPDPGDPC